MDLEPAVAANLAALGAAACWALGGLVAMVPVRLIGPIAFNRLRMVMVTAMLGVVATALGGWATLDAASVGWLALSGLIGITLGDTALFLALDRVGPRRNSVVYATNAPITAVLGWLFLGEGLSAWTALGIAMTTAGVMLAVANREETREVHDWERVRGRLAVGVGLGLVAALCQATGTIAAKPAMAAAVDPVAAAAVRVGTAALFLTAVSRLTGRAEAVGYPPPSPRALAMTALNAFLGLGLGMTLMLVGLSLGKAGVVATLSATSPVLILPLMWLVMRKPPALAGWLGAALAVAGVALIVNR